MLCIEYQNGIANCLPPKSLKLLMPLSLRDHEAEPLVWSQATIFTG